MSASPSSYDQRSKHMARRSRVIINQLSAPSKTYAFEPPGVMSVDRKHQESIEAEEKTTLATTVI